MKTQTIRRFTGELFPKGTRHDINFAHAQLKAYLAGHKKFRFGRDMSGSPAWHFTPEKLREIPI